MTHTGDKFDIDGKHKPIWEHDGKKYIKHNGKLIEVVKRSTETMIYYVIKEEGK